MRARVLFEFSGGLFKYQIPKRRRGKRDNKEWDSSQGKIPFPKVLRYKRRSDIKKVDITEFKVCMWVYILEMLTLRLA